MTRNIEELLGLLAAVALIAWAARAVGLPYPIVLVLGGLGLGYLPGLSDVSVDPEVVFLVFLPPLVHAAAYTTSGARLREERWLIAALALGLVAATVGAVAVVAHELVDGMTWAAAFVLGAVVAPTDPVAATAVFRRAGVPERIVAIIGGESLVNDASALVGYRVAVAAVTAGTFSALDGAVDLVTVSVGGVAVGWVTAYVAAWLRRRLEDPPIEVTVTLLTPYLGYIAAEELGVSGILAAVVSGIILGRMSVELFSPGTRLQAYSFWEVLTFLLESMLFILIGLEFPRIAERVDSSIVVGALGVCVAVIAVRMLYALALPRLPAREKVVIGWTGMRGAVSLAAALAIPRLTDSGAPFPARDEIIFLTLLVIGVTLVLQGLTLPLVLRGAVAEPAEPAPRQKALARFEGVEAALERIGELSLDSGLSPATIERARELYTQRASQLAGECRTGIAEDDTDTAAWIRLRLDLLDAERRELREARDRGDVSSNVLREIERDLDLEAARLQSRIAA